jgi:hypothetical protein
MSDLEDLIKEARDEAHMLAVQYPEDPEMVALVRRLADALEALTKDVTVEERWIPIPVSPEQGEWAPRSKAEAERSLKMYPPEWTFWGEEEYGPNGLKGMRGEKRQVWRGPWVEVTE